MRHLEGVCTVTVNIVLSYWSRPSSSHPNDTDSCSNPVLTLLLPQHTRSLCLFLVLITQCTHTWLTTCASPSYQFGHVQWAV